MILNLQILLSILYLEIHKSDVSLYSAFYQQIIYLGEELYGRKKK